MLTRNKYEIFKSRLNQELKILKNIEDEFITSGLIGQKEPISTIEGIPVTNHLLKRGIASMLAETYSCTEKVLLLIAENIDETAPQGNNWHTELLKQMSININSIRPYVISDTTTKLLNELRAFRHIQRNIYGADLYIERLYEILEFLPTLLEAFYADIEIFIQSMDELFY